MFISAFRESNGLCWRRVIGGDESMGGLLMRRCLVVALLGSTGAAWGQPAPTGAAARYPQPVVVGTLLGRQVLQPVEAQNVLGRVAAVVRRADGGTAVVLRLGGVFGIGAREVTVPIEAMVLLGEYMEVVDLSPAQLRALPTASAGAPLPADAVIRVGLARPSH